MSTLPTICICTAAAKDDLNLVWVAQGQGDGTFSRALCATGFTPTSETPPTHYLMMNMSAQTEDAATWQGMCNGALPPISGVWGEGGIIDSASAQSACTGGNLQVFTGAGLDETGENGKTPVQWRDGLLAGLNYQFVPEEIIGPH